MVAALLQRKPTFLKISSENFLLILADHCKIDEQTRPKPTVPHLTFVLYRTHSKEHDGDIV